MCSANVRGAAWAGWDCSDGTRGKQDFWPGAIRKIANENPDHKGSENLVFLQLYMRPEQRTGEKI